MKLAVTGITSKTGSAFFENVVKNEAEFLEKWDGIRLFFRSNKPCNYVDDYRGSIRIERVIGDIESIPDLEKLMDGCDTVLHITKIQQSEKIMQAAINNGTKRIIAVHTTGMYSKYKEAGKEYKRIDDTVQELAEQNGIDLTIVRPTMIYGKMGDYNISRFIKLVDKFRFVPVVNGAKYYLQPVHYKDLGKAFYTILMNPEKTIGKQYNLSGENPIMLREMLEMIADDLGVKRGFINCPYPIAYTGACAIRAMTIGKVDVREQVQRLCEDRAFSHEDATFDFGYQPRPFSEGLREEVEEYKHNSRR